MKCPGCGSPLSKSDKTCPRCGAARVGKQGGAGKRRLLLLCILLSATIICSVVVILVVLSFDNANSLTEQTVEQIIKDELDAVIPDSDEDEFLMYLKENMKISVKEIQNGDNASAVCTVSNSDAAAAYSEAIALYSDTGSATYGEFSSALLSSLSTVQTVTAEITVPLSEADGKWSVQLSYDQLDACLGGFLTYAETALGMGGDSQ